MKKCINCKKEYTTKALCDYNLGLCDDCYDKLKDKIDYEEGIEKLTVTCPKCKKEYGREIMDSKCKTEGCNVHFFWNADHTVVARWIDL